MNLKNNVKPASIIAQFEQAEASAKSLAILLGSYYADLKANDIPDHFAMALVQEFQRYVLSGGKQ